MHLVGLSWSQSCKIHCSSHISPSSVVHHTGSLLDQQHQIRFSSVNKACQSGLWNKCCFVPVVWSCLLEPSMKRFWQNKNLKVIFSKIQEPGSTPVAYIDSWTSFSSQIAAPRSTKPSSKWCFVLVSHFLLNLFNGVSALSRASFQNMRCNSSLRTVPNSSLINGTIGLSV